MIAIVCLISVRISYYLFIYAYNFGKNPAPITDVTFLYDLKYAHSKAYFMSYNGKN